MKLTLHIDYHTRWGENLMVCGSAAALGAGDTAHAMPMAIAEGHGPTAGRCMLISLKAISRLNIPISWCATATWCAENGVSRIRSDFPTDCTAVR